MSVITLDDLQKVDPEFIWKIKDKTFLIEYLDGKKFNSAKVVLVGFDINRKKTTYFFKNAEVNYPLEYRVKKYDQEHAGTTPLMFAVKMKDIVAVYTSVKLSKAEQDYQVQTATYISNRMLSRIDWNKLDNDRLAREGKLVTSFADDVTTKSITA